MSTTWLFLICYKNERVRGDYKSCLICTHCSSVCYSVCVPVVAFYTGLITQRWRFSSRASCANGDNQYQSPLHVLLVLQNCTAVKSNDRHDEKLSINYPFMKYFICFHAKYFTLVYQWSITVVNRSGCGAHRTDESKIKCKKQKKQKPNIFRLLYKQNMCRR